MKSCFDQNGYTFSICELFKVFLLVFLSSSFFWLLPITCCSNYPALKIPISLPWLGVFLHTPWHVSHPLPYYYSWLPSFPSPFLLFSSPYTSTQSPPPIFLPFLSLPTTLQLSLFLILAGGLIFYSSLTNRFPILAACSPCREWCNESASRPQGLAARTPGQHAPPTFCT